MDSITNIAIQDSIAYILTAWIIVTFIKEGANLLRDKFNRDIYRENKHND
jgi:hypothetical protein